MSDDQEKQEPSGYVYLAEAGLSSRLKKLEERLEALQQHVNENDQDGTGWENQFHQRLKALEAQLAKSSNSTDSQ